MNHDIESLRIWEDFRQSEGECRCCSLIKSGKEMKIQSDIEKDLYYKVIAEYCPICGKQINN